MSAIIQLLIPIALQLLEMFLNSKNADAKMKKQFFQFAERMSGEYLNSVRLRDSYHRQLKELKKKEGV